MDQVIIRECTTIAELDNCVRLQREVFKLPELEISPRRHLIVSRQAGGWTLGAFTQETSRLVGFVHNMAAVGKDDKIFGYSHMMAVDRDYQNQGVGAKLKWAQRERALKEGRDFIKWTWDPMQARNAHFNLNRLGVIVRSYAENFYGTDYGVEPKSPDDRKGIDSDRLFANWELLSPRVVNLIQGEAQPQLGDPRKKIEIPADWSGLLNRDSTRAREEQIRVRSEFKEAFAAGLVCAGFTRSERPHYLFYEM